MLQRTKVQQLLDEGLNIAEVATELQTPYHKLYRFIRDNNIKYNGRENNGKSNNTLHARSNQRKLNDKDRLYQMYITNNMSLQQIAEHYDTTKATVSSALKRFDIPVRLTNGSYEIKAPRHTRQLLEKLYVEDKLSLEEIATLLGYTNSASVKYDFQKHGIGTRDYQQAGYWLYQKHPEKRELHRKQFYAGITGPRRDKITSLEQSFIDWANSKNIDIIRNFQIRRNWHRYDFKICNTSLLVEMDGVFWHSLPEHVERDNKFMETAERYGYMVIRITDKQVENDPQIFDNMILPILQQEGLYANQRGHRGNKRRRKSVRRSDW